jgi:type I restriction enzyme R subunit
VARLRAEVAAARKASRGATDQHNYNEAETRDRYIDLLLREAGWALDKAEDREFRVEGMPNKRRHRLRRLRAVGRGRQAAGAGRGQAHPQGCAPGPAAGQALRRCLEARFGQRPVIFYSNGYEHWIWDDTRYPPRQIGGFYKRDELELLIQRRTGRKTWPDTISRQFVISGPYQQRAIRAIAKVSRRTASARRCWSWRPAPARRAR